MGCDSAIKYLFGYLLDMGKRRQIGMAINPISWSDLESWQRLKRITLLPWETEMLDDIEAIYIALQNGGKLNVNELDDNAA